MMALERVPWRQCVPLLLLFALLVVLSTTAGETANEDAYIAFRYADNLAHGHGFVFNPGEPPCQGFSSVPWVVLLALLHAAGARTVLAAQTMGIVFSALTVCMLYCIGLKRRMRLFWLAPLMLTLDAHFIYHSTLGLESPLYTFLVVASLFQLQARAPSVVPVTVTLFLLGATRPEGAVVSLGLLGAAWVLAARDGLADHRRRFGAMLVGLLGLLAAFTLWRYLVFGSLLSSPAIVKLFRWYSNGGRVVAGLHYLRAFVDSNPALLLAVPGLVVAIRSPRARRLAALVTVTLCCVTATIVLEGGDAVHLKHWRFFLPLLPLLYLAVGLLVDRVGQRLSRGKAALVTAAAVLVMTVHLPRDFHDRGYRHFVNDAPLSVAFGVVLDPLRGWRAFRDGLFDRAFRPTRCLELFIGRWLARSVDGRLTLATGQAGLIPYFSRLRVYDLVGLACCDISHARSRPKVIEVLRRLKPDLFLLTGGDFRFFGGYLSTGRYRLVRYFTQPKADREAYWGELDYYLFAREGSLTCEDARAPREVRIGPHRVALGRSCVVFMP